ncbi:MAG: hypothetical protein OEQ28_02115, partial [Acidobacteriota bacterium]|nr:hypothetical protein [Acidobacteriota bacterium]
MRLSILNIVFLLLALFVPISGQSDAAKSSVYQVSGNSKTRFFPLESVKAGLTGTARTVFSGSKSESFDVKILGVLPNGIGPRQDLIVGTISGGGADRTKVFAGMSGSPVYIDGKLVGAISYAFPFSTEAICGITPIGQMISIFERTGIENPESRSPRTYSFSELASNHWSPKYSGMTVNEGIVAASGPTGSELNALYGQSFKPIATPLSFSGFSRKTLDRFSPELIKMGLLPVTGVASGSKLSELKKADDDTLIGGDSVAVELARGDMSIAANGTVTLRDGDRVYAFGHPFLSLGVSSLP